jgi:hypothetical protein
LTGTAAGQICIMVVSTSTGGVISTPAGWTALGSGSTGYNPVVTGFGYGKILTASDVSGGVLLGGTTVNVTYAWASYNGNSPKISSYNANGNPGNGSIAVAVSVTAPGSWIVLLCAEESPYVATWSGSIPANAERQNSAAQFQSGVYQMSTLWDTNGVMGPGSYSTSASTATYAPAYAAAVVIQEAPTNLGFFMYWGGYMTTVEPQKSARIDSINPTSGSEAGGDHVTVYGSGLQPTTVVLFGGIAGTGLYVSNDSTLVVASPAAMAGVVDISLDGGNGAAVLPQAFTYVAIPVPPDPSELPLFEYSNLSSSGNGTYWWASGTLSDAEQDVSDWVGEDIALSINGSLMAFTIQSGSVPGPDQPHVWQAIQRDQPTSLPPMPV